MPDGFRRPRFRRRLPRFRRRIRVPRWKIATIVVASTYDPVVGKKRNLEVHIRLPLRAGTRLSDIEEILIDRGLLYDILDKADYNIPPFSEVEVGIEWEEEEYTILEVPREVEFELVDYDYNAVRATAKGSLERLPLTLEGLLEEAESVIEDKMTRFVGKRGRKKKESKQTTLV